MTPEEFEQIKFLIKVTIAEEVESACKNKFKVVFQKLESIAKILDINFANMDEDRKNSAEIITNQASIQRLTKEVLNIMSNQTNRLTKTVENKADQAIEESATAVAESVEPAIARIAKKISKGVKLNKRPWWQFWR